ncbi:MAG: YihY/virulence factor BrkB family protein [Steroidobacteraceae bacterium]
MLDWTKRLENGLFHRSRLMPPPWGPALRLLRYPAAIIRDWLAGDIAVRAMSLAYTTLLSVVPLMAFSFSILKGFGARGDLRYLLHQFFSPMGGAAEQLTDSVMQFVANMHGDVLGSLGLAFLGYTVVSTIQKIEASFNFLWRVDKPRSLGRRFTEYSAVMIIGPILLAVAVGLLGSARDSPFASWLDAVPSLGWMSSMLGQLVPYGVVIILFTLMYGLVPNTRVTLRAALIGGVSAGVLWALVGRFFTTFIVYSSQMIAIYAGFAIVLTTLIWVYLSWLILLIGAQLAFYVQFPHYLPYGQKSVELSGCARERAALSVMYLLGRDYRVGTRYWTGGDLAEELDIPGTSLAPVLASLEAGGLIIATEKEEFVPARDAAGIELAAVLQAVRLSPGGRYSIDPHGPPRVGGLMAEVDAAIHERLGRRSLKDLLEGSIPPQ